MTAKYFAILTNQGAARLANAAALGTKLNLTQMAVGDANGTLPTPDPSQTKLINQKRIAPLNLLTVDPANTSQIIAEQIIPENEGGFWIREIGLYDDDGILIAVANCPETYKPQLQEGSGRTQTIRMILVVSSTSAITLKIDPAVVLATRQYVDDKIIEVKGYADDLMKKHVEAANPHKQYPLIANALKEMVDAGLAGDVLKNLGLGEAAKRNVGTGENQIPDMASFASGDGWMKLPNGKILQYGRGAVTPTLSTQTMRITFSIPFPKKADCAMLTHSGDGGAPLGAGRGFVMTAEGPTLTGFNSAYRTSSTSDTVSMNYSWWAVGE
ncbi:phage tail protein [Escherichia coli]|nr:phage tail protein [Escherichia coli]EEU9565699.1 phage tail protein [Escherichia coli]